VPAAGGALTALLGAGLLPVCLLPLLRSAANAGPAPSLPALAALGKGACLLLLAASADVSDCRHP
jgi:hypothetical protein